MNSINLNDIVFRHLIKFDYDVSNAVLYKAPHHLFNIEDSIHYKTINSDDFSNYNTLLTTTDQKEHSEEIFKALIKDFNEERLGTDKIRIFLDNTINKYVVKDGCHRLAILKHKGINKAPVSWFNIER